MQLRQLYKVICAEYVALETLYEAEKSHARNARRLATLPSISCWPPESHHHSADETSMLEGGDSCANKFHYIRRSDTIKGCHLGTSGCRNGRQKKGRGMPRYPILSFIKVPRHHLGRHSIFYNILLAIINIFLQQLTGLAILSWIQTADSGLFHQAKLPREVSLKLPTFSGRLPLQLMMAKLFLNYLKS